MESYSNRAYSDSIYNKNHLLIEFKYQTIILFSIVLTNLIKKKSIFYLQIEMETKTLKKKTKKTEIPRPFPKGSKILISKAKELGSSVMHKGLWSIVFSFVGLNRELIKLRIVSRKWKKNIEYAAEIMINNRKARLESHILLTGDLDPQAATELKNAIRRREGYERFLPLIPRKWALFSRLSDIAKLQKPPICIQESLISVLNLTISDEEFNQRKGIDWKYCQDALKKKNFMDILTQTTPDTIDDGRVRRFEYNHNRSMITVDYLHHECNAAAFMLEWALALVDCFKQEKTLEAEVRTRLQRMAEIRAEQVFVDNFSKLFNKMLKSK